MPRCKPGLSNVSCWRGRGHGREQREAIANGYDREGDPRSAVRSRGVDCGRGHRNHGEICCGFHGGPTFPGGISVLSRDFIASRYFITKTAPNSLRRQEASIYDFLNEGKGS